MTPVLTPCVQVQLDAAALADTFNKKCMLLTTYS